MNGQNAGTNPASVKIRTKTQAAFLTPGVRIELLRSRRFSTVPWHSSFSEGRVPRVPEFLRYLGLAELGPPICEMASSISSTDRECPHPKGKWRTNWSAGGA